jgi:FRG domain
MIVTETFDSWGEFKSRLPDLHAGSRVLISRFLFRGQAHSDWSLTSGFDRSFSGDDHRRQDEFEKYLGFFRHLNRRLGLELPDNDMEVGAIAQHYGMPTRLIDWSLSPYTAAFFAFYYGKVDRVDTTHIAVWGLEAMRFKKEIDPRYFELVTPKIARNLRMHRQSGKFVVARGEFSDLRKYVDD